MKPRRSRHAPPSPARWQAYALAALVLVAIVFGGGGAEGPINNGVIQGLSAILLALLFASHVNGSWPLAKVAQGLTWLLLALFMIVILQLVPLPPAMWQSLPGRDLAESALSLIDSSDEWRPHSLNPDGTARFAASLLLPMAILYGLLGATRRETLLVVRAVVIAAGLSALIGALQLTLSTPAWLIYYEGPNPGAASGVFANPNHHATLLTGAILCLAMLMRAERRSVLHGSGGAMLLQNIHPGWLALPFFVAMILATGSRAGLILLALAAPGALLIALGRRSPLLWLGGLAAVGLAIVVTILFSPSDNYLAIGHSFIFSRDSRYSFLPDVLYTLRQYWPWGSGLGTFVQVFAPNENLDFATPGYVNHAHNDLLEWLIETGIVGAIWLLLAVTLVLWRLTRVAIKRNELRGSQFAAVLTGALILLLLALHSLVDFPMRLAAISALGAIGVALIFSPMTDAPPRAVAAGGGQRWPLAVAGAVGLIIGGLALRLFAVEAAVRDGNGQLAYQLRPQHGGALELAAEEQLKLGNARAASQLATESIDRAPLNPAAVRILAMTQPPATALQTWRIASAMGWRDGRTQLWAVYQALANEEFEVAAVRADAFLRTRSRRPQEYLSIVRTAALDPRLRAALIERLKLNPTWKTIFFQVPPKASNEELMGVYQVLRDLAASESEPELRDARATITRLIEREEYAAATDLYRNVRGELPPSGELLHDGSFDRPVEDYRSNSTPLDWQLTPSTGGTATIEEQDGRFLLVETDGSAARTMLRRYVPVDPGRYRLEYHRRGEPESVEVIGIRIRCAGGEQVGSSPMDPLEGSGFEQREIIFEIGPNCPMIMIGIEARAAGPPATAEFDNFSLRRVGQPAEAPNA